MNDAMRLEDLEGVQQRFVEATAAAASLDSLETGVIPGTEAFLRNVTFSPDGQVCLSNTPIPPPALEGSVLEIICLDADYDPSQEAQTLSQR